MILETCFFRMLCLKRYNYLFNSINTKMANGSWNIQSEIDLFAALRQYKPIGTSRHHYMYAIWEFMRKKTNVTPDEIWSYLGNFYELDALNETEAHPLISRVEDFSLPDEDYGPLIDDEFPRFIRKAVVASSDANTLRTTIKLTGITSSTSNTERKRTRQSAGPHTDTPVKKKRT